MRGPVGWLAPHCWLSFCVGLSVDVGTDGVRATLSAGWSVMMSPPRVFHVCVCVCLCACMPACAGAVTPRSAVAPETRPAAGEFPLSRQSDLTFVLRWVNVVADADVIRSPGVPSGVGRPQTLSPPLVFDVVAGACICVYTPAYSYSYATVSGGYANTANS